MFIDSIDTLLAVLRRSQLLAPEQVEEVARQLVPHYPDPLDLGQYLVQIEWLTAYQLQLLLGGQWDEATIGPFNVLDRLGEGGISEVFKAWDTVRGRVVALKVLHHHLAGKSNALRAFQREIQAITRLAHPNIIKTYDAHREGTRHYFAMEYVEGMDLERYVKQVGPLPVEMACDYARQAAQGLQHAHQAGLVHRDIKPANLFLLHPPLPGVVPNGKRQPDPVVKVLDWGLARCMRGEGDVGPKLQQSAEELEAEKGSLIGTADYIAPEQARDATLVDTRADIYSLGCTLFYLLTGRPPYQGSSLMQKLMQHQEAPLPSVRTDRPDVPVDLAALIQKMLAKEPEDRPQIPLLVVTPLRRFCQGAMSANGTGYRPGSSSVLPAVNGSPGTAFNLSRPETQSAISRPGTSSNLPRPSSLTHIPRPGTNGRPGAH